MNSKTSREQILSTPLCLLDLSLKGTTISKAIRIVKKELKEAKVQIDLDFWISDEWFCPDGITAVAIPFYLLNDKLIELEKEYMGFVEGADLDYCLKILRHEIAHALDNAYGLRQCEERASLFGDVNTPYPDEYKRKPYSKSYVINLVDNYAQAHPEEDWAETFAVWLNPNSDWKKVYKEWPALKKLKYVDRKMKEIQKTDYIVNHDTVDEISTLPHTVEQYLNKRKNHLNKYQKPLFGRNLNRIFSKGNSSEALKFLNAKENEICRKVAKNTNQYHYIVRDVYKELKKECKTNRLTLKKSSRETKKVLESLLISKTRSYIKIGKDKVIM